VVWINQAANVISLSFIDPGALLSADALPLAYEEHVQKLTKAGKTVMFSIGGASFSDRWLFLSSKSQSMQAAEVCAGWAKKYGVGIEIDYEGDDAQSAGWQVRNGVSSVSSTFANLGVFIEHFRSLVPMGQGHLSLDVYASQGGAPCLSYFANRYLPGMPTSNPSWITSGADVGLKLHALDWVNIMVAGGDSYTSTKAFLDGYVGANAHVANQYNPVGIVAPIDAGRATISMIASHHCKSYDSDLKSLVGYVKQTGVKGIMFWAIAPFGCNSASSPLKVADWDCSCNANAPGLVAGKSALVGQR
jgi:hypothetical protein